MSFPKKFTRVTMHAKPRYQVYQPGFNNLNSCWLAGEWMTVPKEEWDASIAEYEALAAEVHAKKQHHRDPGTPPEAMTAAQLKAFDHFSGSAILKCIDAQKNTEYVTMVSVNTAGGNRIGTRCLQWLRKSGYSVIRLVRDLSGIVDQAELYNIPADLVYDALIDADRRMVKQNIQQNEESFYSTLRIVESGSCSSFAIKSAAYMLISEEKGIIRREWNPTGWHENIETTEEMLGRYVRMRRRGLEVTGFLEAYEYVRASQNSCARSNLDSSDGALYSFVLPVFKDDGSHEPMDPRDVPWNADSKE